MSAMRYMIEVYRDGTTLVARSYYSDSTAVDIIVDDLPGAGTHVYSWKVTCWGMGGGESGEVGFRRLVGTAHNR